MPSHHPGDLHLNYWEACGWFVLAAMLRVNLGQEQPCRKSCARQATIATRPAAAETGLGTAHEMHKATRQ